MKHWLARLSLGVIFAPIATGCSARSSGPERISSTSEALAVTGTSIVAGWGHSCELLSDGTVQCWGDNHYSELGNGTNAGPQPSPITVPGLSGVTAISGSYNFMCALLSDQTVKCWGYG